MDTPIAEYERKGLCIQFREVPLSRVFELNGNLWVKRTTRTGAGIWPAILPKTAYFRAHEVCKILKD